MEMLIHELVDRDGHAESLIEERDERLKAEGVEDAAEELTVRVERVGALVPQYFVGDESNDLVERLIRRLSGTLGAHDATSV
jgi:hypothetical protein